MKNNEVIINSKKAKVTYVIKYNLVHSLAQP